MPSVTGSMGVVKAERGVRVWGSSSGQDACSIDVSDPLCPMCVFGAQGRDQGRFPQQTKISEVLPNSPPMLPLHEPGADISYMQSTCMFLQPLSGLVHSCLALIEISPDT